METEDYRLHWGFGGEEDTTPKIGRASQQVIAKRRSKNRSARKARRRNR